MLLERWREICEEVGVQVARAVYEILAHESRRCDFDPFTFWFVPKWKSIPCA
jgi:hypothetical protein